MLRKEDLSPRLRDVVEFEVNFAKRAFEKELAEKDEVISEKDEVISQKDGIISEMDNEIRMLKAKLKLNGIEKGF